MGDALDDYLSDMEQGGRMSDTSKEPVSIDHYGVVTEGAGAIKFRIEDGPAGECVWIPRSELLEQDDDTFEIPEWLAVDRGLV